ncbi:MAG: bifunctional UDP-N-acetylglucosamine diphosphorylase/glucosamine-1-phosphate N-acetyltransferase GlmU [Oligoflexia bacterium]|nr:bifunctional UDP-N-acetylglucosamine diphosphorylase/glucosamine-1-phosphate N-acetyltransferase GlmU [Oligoflexia bacterium]MBF0364777.1 bifunctional UDP-N-acetylglucosamine diphosphorylase/glucosamine-1-phosphate N-acetyltransferase GlmU [Oligoflexia bacterium]
MASATITNIHAIILAAGEGKRLKSAEAKPLLPILGKRMIDFSLEEFFKFTEQRELKGEANVVVGHRKQEVIHYIGLLSSNSNNQQRISFSTQHQQLGTGDAVHSFFKEYPLHQSHYSLVMCADTPLIRATDILQLYNYISQDPSIDGVVATFATETPFGYGRIIHKGEHSLRIIEEKDATISEKQIKEVNAGLYIFKTSFLKKAVQGLTNNNQSGEFYLTDVFIDDSATLHSFKFENGDKFLGINSLDQLEEIESILLKEKLSLLREKGVRFLSASTTYIDWDVTIDKGAIIYPHVMLLGNTSIGADTIVESGAVIKNSTVAKKVHIKAYSYIDASSIKDHASIGPFAHLRPESKIDEEVKVGNFVEVKKSVLSRGAKVSHLSYIGDAKIGEETNIGCGFITCNYDGKQKHKTVVGNNTFIGSDCQAIAPVSIGDNAFVAAGSTITETVPSGAFAIARSRQVTKEGLAKRFLPNKSHKPNK